jgi:hypothetical protein
MAEVIPEAEQPDRSREARQKSEEYAKSYKKTVIIAVMGALYVWISSIGAAFSGSQWVYRLPRRPFGAVTGGYFRCCGQIRNCQREAENEKGKFDWLCGIADDNVPDVGEYRVAMVR